MSVFDTTGAESCRRCGENARAEVERLQAENERLHVELTDLRLKSCPSCGIKVENEKLRNENARMRSCLSDDVDNARQIMGENKKLRELVKLDWEWAHSCCGSGCRLNTEHCGYAVDRECNFEREIYERMHELGIEVDE